ncbi:2,3-diphosphoglycerate-dependent phosphoglycerate mutase [Vagococcus intermedius]|uniref:2,3-bisphosphoglycerate-dependent phosphoglycerate mutase n=1 Tax=Vagococcus intermedius TaxID=2991418 RepID=A0AAF0I7W8_9ENTE|nr:2,3-diphosphoglycerate-dependent phosphoglycerate mutase [Vagococcus intermedius]WEG73366.1 2,3-diphosphoglycerate-dependent phosphoglycerate mutase [Vagococcus intermedius]WEG75447.1 2,3-diphosphoglycerate-dependent phosphoglycerate mutase [Vagococcus intermedius]
MPKLIFVRHGLSEWNALNQFTGWVDVDLSEKGIAEAKLAGQKIKQANITFDVAYTSVLKRAIKTCHYVLDESDQLWVPEYKSWRLNERHYGALQGLNKQETADKYGVDQVQQWRRSYDTLPPLLASDDPSSATHDRRYHNLEKRSIPGGENLKVTLERVMPYWQDNIAPSLLAGETVLVAAHGNSLRALAKYIENISDDEIMNLEIPTGQPLIYELNDNLSVEKKYYL